jgi:hypothetical protein
VATCSNVYRREAFLSFTFFRVADEDPDPGSDTFLGMGKKSGSGSGMNNLNHISESLGTIFWVKII